MITVDLKDSRQFHYSNVTGYQIDDQGNLNVLAAEGVIVASVATRQWVAVHTDIKPTRTYDYPV